MKSFFALVVLLVIASALAIDAEYVIPPQFEAEADALMKKFEDAKVPKLPDGSCYDVCKAPEALKAEGLAFATKVNAAGGKIPMPKC